MKKCLVWLRRDLRVDDNLALSFATQNFDRVYLLFVFDRYIIDEFASNDPRLSFIYRAIKGIEKKSGVKLILTYGYPETIVPAVAEKLKVHAVCSNRDYEPYAKKRDEKVGVKLNQLDIEFLSFKDTVIFEFDEIKNKQGNYYKVFTPFKNMWFQNVLDNPAVLAAYKIDQKKLSSSTLALGQIRNLKQIGFGEDPPIEQMYSVDALKAFSKFKKIINNYDQARDFPAIHGTSEMSVHLRFGTVSIRHLFRAFWPAKNDAQKVWLSELVWREFYFGILDKNPRVETEAYIEKFKNIKWENDQDKFLAWCQGQTGVPIVDASMRQLNNTGWMHNRCRMIVASYLVKTLLIDWRWGEKYFAQKLIDFDLAANNGGWQWSASTGCDAVPYFRVFNPYRQSQRFDPQGEFIKRFCPELRAIDIKFIHEPYKMNEKQQSQMGCIIGKDYPAPLVNYATNRIKVIDLYQNAKRA